ncbi:MAG: UDP-2,3-diacylglucosamine diphosphatase LpxI [bacterium]|nr:UDP-2,3-diacylglucosamine diphosphatase LpxI [bacterium]
MDEPLGLIAGNGKFPLLLATNYKKKPGARVEAVGFHGETSPELEKFVDNLLWVGVGQIGKLIKFFKQAGVSKAVMAGQIRPTRMFEKLKFDLRGLKLLSRIENRKADSIFSAVAEEMAKDGIELLDSTTFLKDSLAKEKVLTRRQPTEKELEDVRFGAQIARELGRLDIGQTVVVRDKAIVAVEALEGTDETIRRGGKLAGGETVVVKMAKPSQDMRFDVPVIGVETIRTMKESGASVLAVEAQKTLVLDEEEVVELANREGICVMGFSAEGPRD